MLEVFHPYGDHGDVKMPKRQSLPQEYGGAIRKTSPSKSKHAQSRKVFQLEEDKSVIIQLKWNAQGKGMILIGFLFYRSHGVIGRPGYRVDNRTIKRGSQVSNLTVSFERAQTFAYLASYLSWFLIGFYPCEDLVLGLISMTSSGSSKTDFE